MSDIADLANDAAELSLALHLVAARDKYAQLPKTGSCHFCMAAVAGLFCDTDCRDDYQRERNQLQRLGRA